MTEIWKTIENYENYSISSFGQVIKNVTGKLLKGYKYPQGYVCICLTREGKQKRYMIHRLVALAFIPNPESKSQVDHIDNNPSNNSLDNLRWASQSENGMNTTINSRNTSGVKGIFWDKRSGKWCARITIDGKTIHLGSFSTLEEATLVRQTRAKEVFGLFMNACESSS